MIKCDLTLTTTTTIFTTLLERHLENVYQESFLTKNGKILLQSPKKSDVQKDIVVIEILGSYRLQGKDEDVNVFGISAMICFEIVPFSTEQVAVRAICTQPALQPYFCSLLRKIATYWPEVIGTVQDFVANHIQEEIMKEPASPTVSTLSTNSAPGDLVVDIAEQISHQELDARNEAKLDDVQSMIPHNIVEHISKAPRPRVGTKNKIVEIANEREEFLQRLNHAPTKIMTIRGHHCSETLVQRWAPRLHENWNNPNYHWDERDFTGDSLEE